MIKFGIHVGFVHRLHMFFLYMGSCKTYH